MLRLSDPRGDGYRVEWQADESRTGDVILCQRHASGYVERRAMSPFWAHTLLPLDPRNGTEVVASWIESRDQIDSGWTVSV